MLWILQRQERSFLGDPVLSLVTATTAVETRMQTAAEKSVARGVRRAAGPVGRELDPLNVVTNTLRSFAR